MTEPNPLRSKTSAGAADAGKLTTAEPRAADAITSQPTSSALRRRGLELTLGFVFGVVIASLFGPRMVSFWYKPPSADAFSCASSVEQALTDFLKLQLGLALAGALILLLLSFFVRRFFRRRREARAAPV